MRSVSGELFAEFAEVESGTKRDRPGVEFVATDFPRANRFTIHLLAAIAGYEVKLISERVKTMIVMSQS
jgi:hypothetical protein